MSKKIISSGAPWEAIVGYSRAVKVGQHIFVAGTTAADNEGNVLGSDAYTQTKNILKIIEEALVKADSGLKDVVRTRMFVTNVADWEEIGRAHGEVFADIRPAATLVEIKGLINPEMLVEIEVDAFVSEIE